MLESVREIGPAIAARSDEIERARRLPIDLVESIKPSGALLSSFLPDSYASEILGSPDACAGSGPTPSPAVLLDAHNNFNTPWSSPRADRGERTRTP